MHGFTTFLSVLILINILLLNLILIAIKKLFLFSDTEQAETWMTKQEAFLVNDDLGDSLDSVESLLKKHEDFEKSLTAQEEKINALNEFATKLIEGNHYASSDVAQRRKAVCIIF